MPSLVKLSKRDYVATMFDRLANVLDHPSPPLNRPIVLGDVRVTVRTSVRRDELVYIINIKRRGWFPNTSSALMQEIAGWYPSMRHVIGGPDSCINLSVEGVATVTPDLTPVGRIETEADGSWKVMVAFPNARVDRPCTGGWIVGSSRRLADRLLAAVNAGVAVTVDGIRTDVNGETYVDTTSKVSGRRINADLLRLGY